MHVSLLSVSNTCLAFLRFVSLSLCLLFPSTPAPPSPGPGPLFSFPVLSLSVSRRRGLCPSVRCVSYRTRQQTRFFHLPNGYGKIHPRPLSPATPRPPSRSRPHAQQHVPQSIQNLSYPSSPPQPPSGRLHISHTSGTGGLLNPPDPILLLAWYFFFL